MTSPGDDDDDDNGCLLSSDDHHHHHHTNPNDNSSSHLHHNHPTPHQYLPHQSQPIAFLPHFPKRSSPILPSAAGSDVADSGSEATFYDTAAHFAAVNNFVSPSDLAKSQSNKRRRNEELSDGGTSPTAYAYKKSKSAASATSEYLKDREEWSDTTILCLLEAYTEKYAALNRGESERKGLGGGCSDSKREVRETD